MITHEWCREIPADRAKDLDELLADAVAYDAEAGFSTAVPDEAPGAGVEVHHLLVSMPPKGMRGSPDLDRLPDVQVVAYLRLDVSEGQGHAQLVVRPEFRSLGVATLLFERLAGEDDGWASVAGLRDVHAWAHGAHPAAERLSWRFEATQDREVFKTLSFLPREGADESAPPTGGPGVAPDLGAAHSSGQAPADRRAHAAATAAVGEGESRLLVGAPDDELPGYPVLLAFASEPPRDPSELAALLERGLHAARARGAKVASLYVDATDAELLHVSRELGFFHDQSDRLYSLTVVG